jgi:hypothetical protein
MQFVTAVGSGDQQELRARRERKDRNALGCISNRSGEMIHSLSLIRHCMNTRRTTNDNDKPRSSALFGRSQISCSDPLLMTVCTPFAESPSELLIFAERNHAILDQCVHRRRFAQAEGVTPHPESISNITAQILRPH